MGYFNAATTLAISISQSATLLVSDIPKWKQDYFNSCNKFIIAETLSPTFVGMTFSKVAEICYVKLNLLLLAIEARKYEGGNISINPKNKEIQPNAIGKIYP